MDKKIAGLLAAVAGLATMGTAQAAIAPAQDGSTAQPSSYADLLAPVPNAAEALQADDAARAQQETRLAQYYQYPPRYYRRYPQRYYHHPHHHHHHHHHHQTRFIGIPGVGGVVVR